MDSSPTTPRALSTEQIRRWLNRKADRAPNVKKKDDFNFAAMCRVIGLDAGDLYKFRKGLIEIAEIRMRLLSRFIQDWDNGKIAFKGKHMPTLLHLEKPRHPPTVFRIVAGRLLIQPRPPLAARLPAPKDLFGLTKKQS